MPQIAEDLGSSTFKFEQNRPWYPQINVELEDEETGWISHMVKEIGTGWHVILKIDPIQELVEDWDWGEYEGRLRFKFESITGGEYEFIFPIQIHLLDTGDLAISSLDDVSRNLPWDDVSPDD